MKKIELGQTISIFANLGVIIGIALLVVELNQNNTLLRNEARYNLQLSRAAEIDQMAVEPELAAIWEKVAQDESLTALERRRYDASVQSRFVRWEWYYEQYRNGLIAEDVLPAQAWKGLFESVAIRAVWMRSKELYTPSFVQWMEQNVVSPQRVTTLGRTGKFRSAALTLPIPARILWRKRTFVS